MLIQWRRGLVEFKRSSMLGDMTFAHVRGRHLDFSISSDDVQ